jgi:hypothetical protein
LQYPEQIDDDIYELDDKVMGAGSNIADEKSEEDEANAEPEGNSTEEPTTKPGGEGRGV